MGNYQDFLKSAPQPLRDADPEQPKRLHTFGNPFKLDKKASRFDPCVRVLCARLKAANKPAVTFDLSSGHDDRRGGRVCDRPPEQREETWGQQQHWRRRTKETPLHVPFAAFGPGLHPAGHAPRQPPTGSRWDTGRRGLQQSIFSIDYSGD